MVQHVSAFNAVGVNVQDIALQMVPESNIQIIFNKNSSTPQVEFFKVL
jgi:hypothetical protein